MRLWMLLLFFFFQAEDGIRDTSVTGVQTCALPISPPRACVRGRIRSHAGLALPARRAVRALAARQAPARLPLRPARDHASLRAGEIGRASCRERVEIWVEAVALTKRSKRTRSGDRT